MRSRYALAITLLAASAAGCARHVAAPKPVAKPAVVAKARVPLPDWAPKNPSPEFLRAAKVLKPLPPEASQSQAQGEPAAEAVWHHYSRTLPAAWELFGSLTDEQMQRFLTAKPDTDDPEISKLIRVPVKSLTPQQRAALDRWFEAWRTAMRGLSGEIGERIDADRVVTLYKAGAKRDLSNVDVGFNQAGRSVNLTLRVRRPDKNASAFGCTIGTL